MKKEITLKDFFDNFLQHREHFLRGTFIFDLPFCHLNFLDNVIDIEKYDDHLYTIYVGDSKTRFSIDVDPNEEYDFKILNKYEIEFKGLNREFQIKLQKLPEILNLD
jgi:hypothetical protein